LQSGNCEVDLVGTLSVNVGIWAQDNSVEHIQIDFLGKVNWYDWV